MIVRTKPNWHISESQVTDEEVFLHRRLFLKTLGLTTGSIAMSTLFVPPLGKAAESGFPAAKNSSYSVTEKDRTLTKENIISSYNNFYEFSLDKGEVQKKVKDWQPGKWNVQIGGLCDQPKTWDVEELVKKIGIEERIYRFRCVEAWSMVVPWDGFMMNKLIALAQPKKSAKYVMFTSLEDAKAQPNIKAQPQYPWPYTEGLTIEEAMNPLAFFATGIYGKPLPKQNGAPIRAVIPWKYGFKGAKSIVKIDFVEAQPKTLWNELAPSEYGFYANVNPEVGHPRWSQAKETVIDGSFFPKKIQTLKFNGYEKEVAGLYKDLDLKKHY